MTPARRRTNRSLLIALAIAAGVGLAGAPPAFGSLVDEPGTLLVQTVPPVEGARVSADGNVVETNRRGLAALPVPNFRGMEERLNLPSTQVSPTTRVSLDRVLGNPEHGVNGEPVVVGLNTERLVTWRFTARGRKVSTSNVELLELKSNTGRVVTLEGRDVRRPIWLAASRTQQTTKGLVSKDLYWSVSRAIVDGAEVVNRGQQKFFPTHTIRWTIDLLFYRVEFVGRDLLFGGHAGEGIEVTRPDGKTIRVPFVNGMATVNSLPRGSYDVRVYGSGVSFLRPMSVSKDQMAEIEVITRVDVGLIVGVIALTAISLVMVGRRHHIVRLTRRLPRGWFTRAAAVLAAALVLAATSAPTPPAAAATDGSGATPPAFAYYYIWYQPSSWLRAKTDYPLLGRYSSDDPVAARRHIEMAQRAGLTGFLVSWKDTAHLSHRLDMIANLALERDFELGIVYQGLDFYRNPLPPDQVAEDLETFADRYEDHPAFDHFGAPVVVITGTEDYEVSELDYITKPVRDRLQILASAKSPEEYRRTADVVDGEAYYWSSGNPRTAYYRDRLEAMAAAVRDDGGLWLAPAAAGYDARQLGGHRVIRRADGTTLKIAMEAATSTSPDAIAVISWNEFSENSHVEPSQNYGISELEALAEVLGGSAAMPGALASVESPREERAGLTGWGAMLAMLLLAALLNMYLAYRRAREDIPPPRREPSAVNPPEGRHRSMNGKTETNHNSLLLKDLSTRGRRS